MTQPGSSQTSTYTWDTSNYPLQMLAPTPSGSTCSPWVAGCRALQFAYNSDHRLTSVTFKTVDDSGATLSVKVACYAYTNDTTHRLAQAWDPRDATTGGKDVDCSTPVRATGYGYNGAGQLTSITPPGLAREDLTYDATGRLITVARTHNAANGGGTETTAIVYGVAVTADSSHPEYRPDLNSTSIAAWGQTEAPVTAAAVFGPGHAADGSDLRGASVTYLNAEGKTVDAADYAGTGATGWNIDTTNYDSHGNVTSTLTASNRNEALHAASADPTLNLPADTAAAAAALSTVNVYAYDAAGVGDLTDTYGPLHLTTIPGQADPTRTHTHTDYDTGGETGQPTVPVLHLPVKTTTGASQSPLAVSLNEVDQRVTTTDYALSASDATGWTFRAPMKVTTDPAGLNISTITRYDPATGATIETRQPKSAGGDAATTTTVYWTAGTNSGDSACGNKPAWQGLPCASGPAAAPGVSGLPGLPTTRTTAYDYLNRPTSLVETVPDASGATKTRTTTTTFSNGGYGTDTASTATTGGLGADVPVTTTTYDTATGLATMSSTASTSTQPATSSTTAYDDFGRVVAYTDNDQASGAAANTTATAYDAAGRVKTVTDAHGSTTYVYNENGDYRDKATTMSVSGIGDITAAYDADGDLATQTLPGGIVESTISDEAGQTTSRTVTAGGRTWLAETQESNTYGQTTGADYAGANFYGGHRTYSYDAAGRLTKTEEGTAAAASCTTRTYAFDKDSNRTGNATYSPAGDGGCQSSTAASSATHAYDIADRLQAAGTDAGLAYDAWGRITTLPAADTSAGAGNLTVGYYTNDLVRSQTQGGTTQTWTLDADGRLAQSMATGGTSSTKTNHYDDASSDSPDWIAENATASSWTRNITGLDGNLVATLDQAGTLTWQIGNIHGDIAATAVSGATDPGTYYLVDEYGLAIGAAAGRYGALGAKQRSTEDQAGLTLMGVRLYAPVLGRFLSTDPVPGGSANDYAYPTDPINMYDLNGQWWHPWRFASHHARRFAHHWQSGIVSGAALGAAYLSGYRCHRRWGMMTCTGGRVRLYGRGGTTYGSVYITSRRSQYLTHRRINHERAHSRQWRRHGYGFAYRYWRAGSNPCRNRFEREAGLAAGGYRC